MCYGNFCFILYSMNHTCSFKFMTTSVTKGMDSVTMHRNASSTFKLITILTRLLILCVYVYIFIYIHTRIIFQITLKLISSFDEG